MRFLLRFRPLLPMVLGSIASLAACGGKTNDNTTDDSGVDATDSQLPPIDAPVEVTPETAIDTAPDVVAETPPPSPSSSVDLLLVVDNSSSMADKQDLLARTVPLLIRELTAPTVATHKAVADVHVGIVTSSLGSFGTSACDPANPHNDDQGHLLPRAGESASSGYQAGSDGSITTASCPSIAAASALTWTSGASPTSLEVATSCVVETAKDDGCGYESTLESMYHFLIDPSPYASAKVDCTFGTGGDACGTNKILVTGVDSTLLAQRSSFLRPKSTVAVVVLSDENDASLRPAQLNWLPWAYAKGQMQRGWSHCSDVPDDFEPQTAADFLELHSKYNCQSCFESTSDPACTIPWATGTPNADSDDRNLRAFQQTKRFGYNFLWGRQRYVDGLSSATVSSDGTSPPVANSLFSGGRSAGNVFFLAVVGVAPPLVEESSGAPKTLSDTDWAKIISPDPTQRDPHMLESIAPRPAVPKYAGDRTVDPINGGDRDVPDGGDLQYACIARRTVAGDGFDCQTDLDFTGNPLCDAATKKQIYYKAYPGVRQLRIAHDLGTQGMAASICSSAFDQALLGFVDRMQPALAAH